MRDVALDAVLYYTATGLDPGHDVNRIPSLLDPESIVSHAKRHGVVGLVLKGLKSGTMSEGSEALSRALTREIRHQSLACLRQQAALIKATDQLTRTGIEHILLKGPILSGQAYNDNCMRPAGDLDILVSDPDVENASRALTRIGYRQVSPRIPMRAGAWRLYRKLYKHMQFRNDEGFLIELHWRLANEPSLAMVLTTARPAKVEFEGRRIRVLSIEENVLFLCIHGMQHRWERLIWLADVVALLRRGLVDEQRLLEVAREYQLEKFLGLAAALAKEWNIHCPALHSFERYASTAGLDSCRFAFIHGFSDVKRSFKRAWVDMMVHLTVQDLWRYRFQAVSRILVSESMLGRLAESSGPAWVIMVKALILLPVRFLNSRAISGGN